MYIQESPIPTPAASERFTRDNLHVHAGYVTYGPADFSTPRQFVARFKYAATSSARPFVTFLIRNFTPAEYYARRNAGETPLAIAESKGFVLSHIRRWLRDAGLPETPEGKRQLFERQRVERENVVSLVHQVTTLR